jgi:hypothetical protein
LLSPNNALEQQLPEMVNRAGNIHLVREEASQLSLTCGSLNNQIRTYLPLRFSPKPLPFSQHFSDATFFFFFFFILQR